MKRIKVKIIGDGTQGNPFRANLPTYIMDTVDYDKLEAYVFVLDDETEEIDGKVQLNVKRIKEKYPRWKEKE